MIKVENIEVFNFGGAIRGMRNPLNSWHKSDSCVCSVKYADDCDKVMGGDLSEPVRCDDGELGFCIGQADLELMCRLYKAGTEHRKYLRQIFVSMDIIAPLYWWKEFDTYKVGTVANSCSTMHKIHSKEFTLDDFSHEHLLNDDNDDELFDYNGEYLNTSYEAMQWWVDILEHFRKLYLETKDKRYWWQMIQLLPTSYNQKRTVTMNYENVFSMIHQRKNHKLDEWNEFVEVLKSLPYVKEIGELE